LSDAPHCSCAPSWESHANVSATKWRDPVVISVSSIDAAAYLVLYSCDRAEERWKLGVEVTAT
jgi:hypothetical protein